MIKVAIAGIGFMGKTHLGVYQKIGDVEVVALADVLKERTQITSLDAGGNIKASSGSIDLSRARKYTDYEKLLADGGFDIVDICLPTFLHAEYAIKALKAGFNVFCEKPMAMTSVETDRMLEAVEKSGKLFSVGQCLRFWPAYVEVKRLIDSGRYGKVKYAELARFSAPPAWGWENWPHDAKRSGSAALDLHIHDVDMLLFLFGKPVSVRSRGVVEKDGGVSHIASVYSYPGLTAASTGGWICSDSFGFDMRAFFVLEGATIELDFAKDPVVALYPTGGKKTAVALAEGDGYYHELVDFVAGVARGKLSGTVTGRSAADSVKLALIEIESVRTDKELRITF
jgi:predicted dehydrogenase